MKAMHPLSDCTTQVHNLQNLSSGGAHSFRGKQQQQQLPLVSCVVPPSYAATIGCRPSAPVSVKPVTRTFTHNPYAAVVLREPMYLAPSLDVSRDSIGSSASTVSPTSPTIVTVKTPIRRVYRNGRPVPVFTDPTAAVAPASV